MHEVKKIEIINFKSIRHAEITGCRRVNVFIGYPNVGKSNILEALSLFSSLQLDYDFFNFNDICRLKYFFELFFNQDSKETNNVIINENVRIELIINPSNDLDVRAQIKKDSNWVSIFSATIQGNNNYGFLRGSSTETITASNLFLSPIRKYEFSKETLINANRPESLAIPSGKNLLDILQRNIHLRKEIVEIFSEYGLKLIIDRGDQTIKFQKELNDGTAVNIPYHQVADTLRRLIFFKAAIQTNSNSVLLFEEPEAHMFPPYISKFTSDIINDKNENQFFISTHSPFVLNDFMEDMDKEELSIFAVGLKNGETIIKRLSENEINEVYQYGVDLFFNLEDYLKDAVS